MLTARHQVTVILRLLIDRQGQLVHGHAVGEAGTEIGRFATWQELIAVLERHVDADELMGGAAGR